VVGSAAQFLVQVPSVLSLLRVPLSRERETVGVRADINTVITNFLPAVLARGVVQISSWVDTAYASLISERAVAALSYSQTIAILPVSLFGMAISAAELPELSADATKSHEERSKAILERLRAGLERMSFFVVPSAVAFLTVGDLISAALLESGRFTANDSRFTWYQLMGSGVALSAQTSGRLYSSAYYALKNTRTPLLFAAVRVGLGIALGYWAVRILPGQLGLPEYLGAVFITVTTGVTAWVEVTLLKRGLRKELGALPHIRGQLARVWPAALIAGAVTLGLKVVLGARFGTVPLDEFGGAFFAPPALPRLATSLGMLVFFGAVYGVAALAFRVPQARALVSRVTRRARR
jgi:putative peptidoglycan lipid II flippase